MAILDLTWYHSSDHRGLRQSSTDAHGRPGAHCGAYCGSDSHPSATPDSSTPTD